MNIHEALKLAREENKAIRRKSWENACLYHGIDNVLRWFRNEDNSYGNNGVECHLSISLLLADDWELSDLTNYHNNPLVYWNGLNHHDMHSGLNKHVCPSCGSFGGTPQRCPHNNCRGQVGSFASGGGIPSGSFASGGGCGSYGSFAAGYNKDRSKNPLGGDADDERMD